MRWVWLPIRLGIAAMAIGLGVIAVLWYSAGNEPSDVTQLPYVLVAGGAGVGLVVVGAAVAAAQRVRLDRRRVENATARLLTSAARLAAVRERVRSQSPSVPPQA